MKNSPLQTDHDISGEALPTSQGRLFPGQLVCSLAGRDKGRYYVVIGLDAAGRALLADGRSRPFNRPKRKNPCHVQITRKIAADLRDAGGGLRDEDIRAAISKLLNKEG